MFKKVSPNYHNNHVGSVQITRVLPFGDDSGTQVLVRDDSSLFVGDYPHPSHFDLKKQIDSGVPLKEVNSVVFNSHSELTSQDEITIEKKITEQPKSQED